MKKLFLIFILSLLPSLAFAQTSRNPCFINSTGGCTSVGETGAPNGSAPLPVTITGGGGGATDVNISEVNGAPPSASNPIWVAPASSTAFPVLAAPRSALTIAGCTVGAASGLCLPASTAVAWIQIQNTHATNSVACSWGGTAILNDVGSFMLAAGQSASWGLISSGVPTNALNCIASGASTPLYVEYR